MPATAAAKGDSTPWFTDTSEGIVVNVRAQPRSSRTGVEPPSGGAIKVRVRSAPVDGKANKELVEVLAEAFGVAKRDVVFKGGETSKTKRLLVRGIHGAGALGF